MGAHFGQPSMSVFNALALCQTSSVNLCALMCMSSRRPVLASGAPYTPRHSNAIKDA